MAVQRSIEYTSYDIEITRNSLVTGKAQVVFRAGRDPSPVIYLKQVSEGTKGMVRDATDTVQADLETLRDLVTDIDSILLER